MARNKKRDMEIFQNVLLGRTFRQMGEAHGISPERARQVFAKIRRRCLHPDFRSISLNEECKSNSNALALKNMRDMPNPWIESLANVKSRWLS